MNRPLLPWLLAAALLPTSGVRAGTIRVPADQATIQAGIDASSDGDTVLVDPGIYHENLNLRGRKIVLAGQYLFSRDYGDILGTVIDGSQPVDPDSASCVLFISGEDSSTVLEGFTLTGGTGTLWRDIHNGNLYREGGGILCEFSAPLITHNIIVGNDATGPGGTSAGGGGIRIGDANPTVVGNVIAYNAGKYGGGIVLNYTGAGIYNNIVYRNSGGADFGGSGIWVYGNASKPKIIENNTIMENASVSYGGGVYVGSTSVVLRNNIIWANTAPEDPQISLDGGSAAVTYSDVEGGWSGTGNIDADPGIGDTTHRLDPSSPCIDAGNPATGYDDPEDTLNPGSALLPSRGTLRNDIGAFGGPRRGLVYLRIHRDAPLAPSGLRAYSDYATPGSIDLTWTDPTELFNGDPVPAFGIHLYRDSVLIATVGSGVQTYHDAGLVLHQLYRYTATAVTAADSSPFVEASAYAGGSAVPGPPGGFSPADGADGCTLGWLNPSRQEDGTPLNDLAMAYIWRDGVLADSIPMSAADTGAWRVYPDTAMGYHWYRIALRDDETPWHFSAPGDSILGFGGLADSYSEDFENGMGRIYATGSWDTTSATGFGGGHSLTDSPEGNSTISSTSYVLLPPVRLAGRYMLEYRNIAIVRGGQFAAVEVSVDSRRTFTTLKIYNSFFSPLWQDASADSGDWIRFALDLSPYSGDTATLRLKMQTGPFPPWDGWYIDDLSITRVDPDAADTLTVFPGWSMVSLPVESPGLVTDLFPSAGTPAWTYDGGYRQTDSLVPGPGYWVECDSAPVISGALIPADTIHVSPKWNMVGAIGFPVDTSAVRTQPGGIIQSPFYAYEPDSGYRPVSTLLPGRAYWVRSSSAGSIILSVFFPAAAPRVSAGGGSGGALAELEFTDASGRSGRLLYGPPDTGAVPVELPPLPPAGGFDVRYATGRSVERAPQSGEREIPILLAGLRFPVTVRWRSAGAGTAGASLGLNGDSIPLAVDGERTIAECSRPPVLRLGAGNTGEVPARFSLLGNYPNPFNPSTRISFTLPAVRFVSLGVYDLLGREVVELGGRLMAAGPNELEWNAGASAAGVYLYRLVAGEFSATGKLLLVK